MEYPTSQIRLHKNVIVQEGSGPSIIWVTPSRARLLIDAGAASLVNLGPAIQPEIGPSETKPTGPTEKKSFATEPGGQLTGSAKLNETGKAQPSAASAAAHPSPKRKYNKRDKPAAK